MAIVVYFSGSLLVSFFGLHEILHALHRQQWAAAVAESATRDQLVSTVSERDVERTLGRIHLEEIPERAPYSTLERRIPPLLAG
jgi:hypothetical protein